ncbi:unnamed protein product [Ectocarpus sp. 4 AP-2014]
MNAVQLRSTEEFAGKPEFHARRNGEQSPCLRVAEFLSETAGPSRWWGLELRRVPSLLFVVVAVALLTLATIGGRATGFDAPPENVSPFGEKLGKEGPNREVSSQNSTHGGRRTTDIEEVHNKFSSVDPSDSSNVGFQPTAMVSNSRAVVPKTHVSDIFRLVFVAGIEGTGHHYIGGTHGFLIGDNGDPAPRYHHRIGARAYYAPNMMGGEAERFTLTSYEAMEKMRDLAEWAATLPSPGALEFFPTACSYPLNNGPLKVMQYMDLRRMAEVAEGEGIDLRVLYLRRSAKDTVIANTLHRHMPRGMGHAEGALSEEEAFVEYMRVLFTNIAVLQSFLSEIGPEFIVCHDWDRLGNKEQASTIARFISPNDKIAGLVESSLVQTARESSSNDSLPYKGADALVSRLQEKLDAFEPLYCCG